MFETGSGRALQIELPQTGWDELEAVRTAFEELRKERRVTSTRLASLQSERERAVMKDRDALAQAIRKGKADPGGKAVEKVEKDIAACTRRLEALEVALEDTERDLIAVVDEHRDEWAGEAEDHLADARAEYAEAVESLARAYGRVSAAHALVRWARLFPEGETSFRVRGAQLESLKAPHGGPYLLDEVIAGLRDDAYADHPAVERVVTETQRRHEEKVANQQAGRGYYTDDELRRLEENPDTFFHGAGARSMGVR